MRVCASKASGSIGPLDPVRHGPGETSTSAVLDHPDAPVRLTVNASCTTLGFLLASRFLSARGTSRPLQNDMLRLRHGGEIRKIAFELLENVQQPPGSKNFEVPDARGSHPSSILHLAGHESVRRAHSNVSHARLRRIGGYHTPNKIVFPPEVGVVHHRPRGARNDNCTPGKCELTSLGRP